MHTTYDENLNCIPAISVHLCKAWPYQFLQHSQTPERHSITSCSYACIIVTSKNTLAKLFLNHAHMHYPVTLTIRNKPEVYLKRQFEAIQDRPQLPSQLYCTVSICFARSNAHAHKIQNGRRYQECSQNQTILVYSTLDYSASKYCSLIGQLHGSNSHNVIPPWAPLHNVILPFHKATFS